MRFDALEPHPELAPQARNLAQADFPQSLLQPPPPTRLRLRQIVSILGEGRLRAFHGVAKKQTSHAWKVRRRRPARARPKRDRGPTWLRNDTKESKGGKAQPSPTGTTSPNPRLVPGRGTCAKMHYVVVDKVVTARMAVRSIPIGDAMGKPTVCGGCSLTLEFARSPAIFPHGRLVAQPFYMKMRPL